MFYVLLFPQALLCSPVLTEGEWTELTKLLLPISFSPTFLLFLGPPQSLPEKTQLNGVYELIIALTHCWLLPYSATNTQTLSTGRCDAGESHKFTCHLTLVTVQTTAQATEEIYLMLFQTGRYIGLHAFNKCQSIKHR